MRAAPARDEDELWRWGGDDGGGSSIILLDTSSRRRTVDKDFARELFHKGECFVPSFPLYVDQCLSEGLLSPNLSSGINVGFQIA